MEIQVKIKYLARKVWSASGNRTDYNDVRDGEHVLAHRVDDLAGAQVPHEYFVVVAFEARSVGLIGRLDCATLGLEAYPRRPEACSRS